MKEAESKAMTDAAVEKAEIEDARKEKDESKKRDKEMDENLKKIAEEDKKAEDPKVAAKLEAENNEYGEKIVATA